MSWLGPSVFTHQSSDTIEVILYECSLYPFDFNSSFETWLVKLPTLGEWNYMFKFFFLYSFGMELVITALNLINCSIAQYKKIKTRPRVLQPIEVLKFLK